MAGHSKWANIQHRKGRQDAARSKLFSKLSREITVAAKMGTPDPDMNPRLRLAVQNAKAQSMPKDNIERAINKASSGDDENFEEVRYEGYGPNGVAVLVEAFFERVVVVDRVARVAVEDQEATRGQGFLCLLERALDAVEVGQAVDAVERYQHPIEVRTDIK